MIMTTSLAGFAQLLQQLNTHNSSERQSGDRDTSPNKAIEQTHRSSPKQSLTKIIMRGADPYVLWKILQGLDCALLWYPPKRFASAYDLGTGTDKNLGCLASEEVSFKLAESNCQGRPPS